MTHFLSYWEKSVLLRPFDFAVLGAGLLGKQIALKLKEKYPNARVAIIDRSPISCGASTRNAGFACFGSVSEIADDLTRSDENAVLDLARKRRSGIRQLVESFGSEQIGYRPSGSFEIFTDKNEQEAALSVYGRINRLLREAEGDAAVFQEVDVSATGMSCLPIALFNPYEGMLNSGMLNETIGARMHAAGVLPFYGLDVQAIENVGNAYKLHTAGGMELSCAQLILAGNAFAGEFLPEEDIEPARGQIILTGPLSALPFDGIFHADKGYIYFRNLEDRVLIGGGRNHFRDAERTFDMQGTADVRNYLEQYLKEVVLPGLEFETDMHWSGIMAMGREKLPIVKRIDERLIACVRMSGMGVALGPVLSGEVLGMLE